MGAGGESSINLFHIRYAHSSALFSHGLLSHGKFDGTGLPFQVSGNWVKCP